VGGSAAGKLLQSGKKLAGRFASAAERSEVAAAGLDPSQVAKAPGKVAGQAKNMRELGIGGPMAGKNTILEQAKVAQEAIESQRDELAAKFAQSGMRIPGALVGKALRDQAAALPLEGKAKAGILLRKAEEYEALGSVPFDTLNQNRKFLANAANFLSDAEGQVIRQDVHRALNDVMEAAANAAHSGLGRTWRALGQKQAAAIRAEEGASKALDRESKNRLGSLSDYLVGGFSALSGNPLAVVGALGANRFLRGRERSMHAAGMRAAGKVAGPAAGYMSPLGRVLERSTPRVSSSISRLLASDAVSPHVTSSERDKLARDEGTARVQAAALLGQGAEAHFVESLTNPAYQEDLE
jgi:hypothetical protein